MYLYIESLTREQTALQLFTGSKIIKEKIVPSETDNLLLSIVRFLGRGRSFSDIAAIFLHCGPGSFSAVRAGVLLGNTLASVLDIPLVPLHGEVDRKIIYKNSARILKRSKFKNMAVPIYNREPNITIANSLKIKN